MRLALGLDCGGSSSRALVLDAAGTVVHTGRSGSANIATTPPSIIADHLRECLAGSPPVTSAVGCFAGLLTPADAETAHAILRSVVSANQYDVHPDYTAALASADPGTDGVVIAGTGAIVCSFREGQPYKTGGGGPLIGDEGSLCHIGRRALWHTLVSAESLKPGPALVDHLETTFGSAQESEVIAHIYKAAAPASALAQIGTAAIRDRMAGAAYATLAVQEALYALAEECSLHFAKLPVVKLGLTGGLWKIAPHLAQEFQTILNETNTAAYSVSIIEREPVEGAARLAQKMLS